MIQPMTPAEVHNRLTTDLEYFAAKAPLFIKDKEGRLAPYRLNVAQKYLHNRAESMLAKKGYVRILVIKARQLGISTYISARFYHKAVRVFGRTVFIISHIASTTAKLFDMAKRFYDYSGEQMKPEAGASNVHQMTYPGMQGEYSVATAGSKESGRGTTAQLLHWSEVAFCPHAESIQLGVVNAIGLVRGSEIFKESTANGPFGLFYNEVMAALSGKGDYELVFIPWFWLDEYELALDPEQGDMTLTAEEEQFVTQHLATLFYITPEGALKEAPMPRERALRKMKWRRYKITEFATTTGNEKAGLVMFKQEYPSNPVEAFQASGESLVRPEMVMEARKNSSLQDPDAPLIMGVDSAGDGKNSDRTVIVLRRGRVIEEILTYSKMRDMELAGIVAKLIDNKGVDKCFVDVTYGHGTVDRLFELGYGQVVQGVAFNERPTDAEFLNKRSEMIIKAAQWINTGGVRIPDDEKFHADLACVPLDKTTSNGLRYIISKEEIKKILGRSPDMYDAFALTFAYPVRGHADMRGAARVRRVGDAVSRAQGRKSPLSTMDKFRRT